MLVGSAANACCSRAAWCLASGLVLDRLRALTGKAVTPSMALSDLFLLYHAVAFKRAHDGG